MEINLNIIETCDLEQYVVQIGVGDLGNGCGTEWQDLTEPFDTYEEAENWVKHIKNDYHIINSTM